jgi:hypothetical protein
MSLDLEYTPYQFEAWWNKQTRGVKYPEDQYQLHTFARKFYEEGYKRATHDAKMKITMLSPPVHSEAPSCS